MKKKKLLPSFLLMVLGTMLTAIAISVFLLPNIIVSGGVSGIATMLFHTLGVPAGITIIVVNVILLLFGIRVLGKNFILKTLISISFLSVFMEVFSYAPALTDNTLLAALFGGILSGCGLGIVFISGASTGGTDVLGRLLQYKFPAISIGKLMMIVDGIVILASFLLFRQTDLTLYGTLSLFMNTFTIDWLIKRMNLSSLAFVISSLGETISKELIHTFSRGVTIIDVKGAYTMEKKTLLLCALKSSEAADFQEKVLTIDPHAFVIFSQSQYILGKGFYLYR